MKKYWRSESLAKTMIAKVMELRNEQNSAFPQKRKGDTEGVGTFAMNHPGRVKPTELNTICNVIKMYCKQIEQQVNESKEKVVVVSNVVYCNRLSARNGQGCSRVSNRHFGKGTLIGAFAGRDFDPETDAKEYYFYTTSDGVKKGGVPHKEWDGRKGDFAMLINPQLIGLGNLPPNVQIETLLSFDDSTTRKKTPQLEGILEPFNNEITISGVASQPLKLAGDRPGLEIITSNKQSEISGASNINFPLYVISFAKIIMESYMKNIAGIMEAIVHPNEQKRGLTKIYRLLAPMTEAEVDEFTDRVLKTIARMRDWIQDDPRTEQNPDGRWIPMPGTWFDLSSRSNIKDAYLKYYLPWKETEDAIKKKKSHHFELKNAAEIEGLSPGHNLSAKLFRFLVAKYPNNKMIRKASVDKWAEDFNAMMRKEKVAALELSNLITWIYKNESPKAEFWRNKVTDPKRKVSHGLRSPLGICRNYKTLIAQYYDEKSRERKRV